MTRPVMPDDQEFEYLPTQAVADFLATENDPTLDGILFKSTQSDKGDNIVLFHKASRVKRMPLPAGVQLRANTKSWDDDRSYPDYRVSEEVPALTEAKPSLASRRWNRNQPDLEDYRKETLEVVPTSVEVHYVTNVEVVCVRHKVERHRHQMSEEDDL